MAIEFGDIIVNHEFSVDTLLVTWDVAYSTLPIGEYTFDVLRYGSPELASTPDCICGYANVVASGLTNATSFLDTTVNRFKPDAIYYYRILSHHPLEGAHLSIAYGEARLVTPDPVAATIWFQYDRLLSVHGQQGRVLLRRRNGVRCPSCWDETLDQVTKSECDDCYGTSYLFGYFAPLPVSYLATNTTTLTEHLNIDDNNNNAIETAQSVWMAGYPRLQPGDVLIDADNVRYRMTNVQYSERKGFLLRQTVVMEPLPPANIVYRFNAP